MCTKEAANMSTDGKLTGNVDIIEKIKTLPALESFNEDDLKELLKISKIVRYDPGELIVDEANYDGWIYYLISGRVRITKDGKVAMAQTANLTEYIAGAPKRG